MSLLISKTFYANVRTFSVGSAGQVRHAIRKAENAMNLGLEAPGGVLALRLTTTEVQTMGSRYVNM